MILTRELVDEVGLFDPFVPFYYDDTLLSFKTWNAGKRVVTVSGSKVHHKGGGAMYWDSTVAYFHGLRARVCLMFDVYVDLSELAKAFFCL